MTKEADISSQDLQSWSQLPGETNKAYDRFIAYLKLGPDRSIEKVRQKYGKSTAYLRFLEKWSSKYSWVDRAAAYDKYQLTKDMESRKEARELSRQIIVDNVVESARKLVAIALGEEAAEKDQVKSLLSVLDRAGVTPATTGDDKSRTPSGNLYQQINQYYQVDESTNKTGNA